MAGTHLEGKMWEGCMLWASAAWFNILTCSCVIAQKLHDSTTLSISNAALLISVKLAPALRWKGNYCLPPHMLFCYSPKLMTGKMLDWYPQSLKSSEQRCEAKIDAINVILVLHSSLGSKQSREQMSLVSMLPLFPKRVSWAFELDGPILKWGRFDSVLIRRSRMRNHGDGRRRWL